MKKLIAVILLAATPTQSPAEPPAVPASPLAPFAFLAGSCWRASFPNGTTTDTHCFTSLYGGRFLRDRHVVAGAPQVYAGETLYRWDQAAGAIRWAYYASDGSYTGGVARPAGNAISFVGDVEGGSHDGASHLRSTWTREGQGYVALTEAQQGDQWRILWQMQFTRIGAAPAEAQ